jgi:hypothetical protein
MTNTNERNTSPSGYSDFDLGAMAKDHMRDCRLGHCGHRGCQRRFEQRFTAPVAKATAPEVAFDPGFDVGATLKDYLRDRRLGHFGLHDETVRNVPARRTRRNSRRTVSRVTPVTVILAADGSLDKQAMREERIFGNQPLYS